MTIRVGERATLKADVSEVFAAAVSWTILVEYGSSGNGVVSPESGTGPLNSEFVGNTPGEVVLVAYGMDARGVPTNIVRVSLTVVP